MSGDGREWHRALWRFQGYQLGFLGLIAAAPLHGHHLRGHRAGGNDGQDAYGLPVVLFAYQDVPTGVHRPRRSRLAHPSLY